MGYLYSVNIQGHVKVNIFTTPKLVYTGLANNQL